jgi:hypothetical protein
MEIPDVRDRRRLLRLSWHRSRRAVVVSQWRDGVCVASTQIELTDVPEVINLLVRALQEGAVAAVVPPVPPTVVSLRADIRAVARSWLVPRLAPIVALAPDRARGH